MFVAGVAIGAAIGLVGMAVTDFVINGRYWLANRAEAKAQRLRDENLRSRTKPDSSDVPPDRD